MIGDGGFARPLRPPLKLLLQAGQPQFQFRP